MLRPDHVFKSEWQGLLRYWARFCKNRGYWPTINHVAHGMKVRRDDLKDYVAFLLKNEFLERHKRSALRLSQKGWEQVPYEPVEEKTAPTARERKLLRFAKKLVRKYGTNDVR